MRTAFPVSVASSIADAPHRTTRRDDALHDDREVQPALACADGGGVGHPDVVGAGDPADGEGTTDQAGSRQGTGRRDRPPRASALPG